jgi:hypothetical protein
LLQPLVDDWPLEEKLRCYASAPLSLEELIDWLGHSSSLCDQVASFAQASAMNLSGWKEKLKSRMQNNEEIFHHFAYELLET